MKKIFQTGRTFNLTTLILLLLCFLTIGSAGAQMRENDKPFNMNCGDIVQISAQAHKLIQQGVAVDKIYQTLLPKRADFSEQIIYYIVIEGTKNKDGIFYNQTMTTKEFCQGYFDSLVLEVNIACKDVEGWIWPSVTERDGGKVTAKQLKQALAEQFKLRLQSSGPHVLNSDKGILLLAAFLPAYQQVVDMVYSNPEKEGLDLRYDFFERCHLSINP